MLASLLLSASLLVGVGANQGVGEVDPFFVLHGNVGPLDVVASSADKIETGDGWRIHGTLQTTEDVIFGVGYSYRHTGLWIKTAWWVRAGATLGPARIYYDAAPWSSNKEQYLTFDIRLSRGHFAVEPSFFVGRHSTGHAYGVSVLVGVK